MPPKRGDLFQIILIQIKGGGAGYPTHLDLVRLAHVARWYRAKDVLLAQWKKGAQPIFKRLKRK